MKKYSILPFLLVISLGGVVLAGDTQLSESTLLHIYDSSGAYTSTIQFPQLIKGNVDAGRRKFGLSDDGLHVETSQALFEGLSVIYGPVVSNKTACSTCHRPEATFLLPPLPIRGFPADDPLIAGRNAEAQGDPRQAPLFITLGLIKQRPGRFNPLHPEDDPFRQVFAWRKTQTILNMAFGYGLLTDGRARFALEQIRGAIFTHTQDTDVRFDDIADPPRADIAAWMQTVIAPPILKDLLDPTSPNYAILTSDPFYTVPVTTAEQQDGQKVFEKTCMSCHNMPNVFGNREHIAGPPQNYALLYGRVFDIGVAQQNKNNLDFRYYDAQTNSYATIVLPLVREDGQRVDWPVTDDLGAAAATGRYEDLHRFKVPQLRNIAQLGPYFHDNSAATLEEVVEYFNSDAYNNSKDGSTHPIHLNDRERNALLEFLKGL